MAFNPARPAGVPVLLRVLPSFTDLAFLVPILFLFLRLGGAKRLLSDGDTGWHIRTGEWILAHHAAPKIDLFSFSKAGQPWFAWEWLWDAAFAVIHRGWGLTGVVFVNALLLGAVSVLLFRWVGRHGGNPVLGIAVTLLAMAASAVHWLARPHVAGWVCLLVFASVLQRVLEGRWRMVWWLPVITLVWTNVHGSFFIGLGLLGAHAAGLAFTALVRETGEARGELLCQARRLTAAAVACAAVTLVNPYGWELQRHVLTYLLDARQLEHISEYQSLSFHQPGALFFEAMLFLALGAVGWCFRNWRIAEGLIVAVWAHLALLSCRNIPLFAFLAAPVVAQMIQDAAERAAVGAPAHRVRIWARRVRDFGSDFRAFENAGRFHVVSAAAVLLLAVAFWAPSKPARFTAEYDPQSFPSAALRVLEQRPGSRIFSDEQWGDYLIYNLYPQYRVFVDGRSDFYGAEFDERLLKLENAHYDWESLLAEDSIDTVLTRADAPLSGVIKGSRNWSLLYDDGIALVFRSRRAVPGVEASEAAREKLPPVSTDGKERFAGGAAGKPEHRTSKPNS